MKCKKCGKETNIPNLPCHECRVKAFRKLNEVNGSVNYEQQKI